MTIKNFSSLIFLIISELIPLRCFSIEAEKEITTMNETLTFKGVTKYHELPYIGTTQISVIASGLLGNEFADHTRDINNNISNSQLLLKINANKISYYLQAGQYVLPSLGEKITNPNTSSHIYGYIPHAYVSASLGEGWSLTAGKLLSMPGYENPFTYQNQNIQRGILERHNNTISNGLQLNYEDTNKLLFTTLNDGFYSGQLSWLGIGGSYKWGNRNTSTLMWGGSYRPTSTNTLATPLLQNNSQIINIAHNLNYTNWSITPYYQFTTVDPNTTTLITSSLNTNGLAAIINYRLINQLDKFGLNGTINLPVRVEKLQVNSYTPAPQNQLSTFSNASSITFTPTIQSGIYFFRTEFSHIHTALPIFLNSNNENRILLEAGLLY